MAAKERYRVIGELVKGGSGGFLGLGVPVVSVAVCGDFGAKK